VIVSVSHHLYYTSGTEGQRKRQGERRGWQGNNTFLGHCEVYCRDGCYFFGEQVLRCTALQYAMEWRMAEMVCACGLGGEERADIQELMNSNCLSILQNTEEVI
jgi:hypothetical protein